jgi:hypothetical protein
LSDGNVLYNALRNRPTLFLDVAKRSLNYLYKSKDKVSKLADMPNFSNIYVESDGYIRGVKSKPFKTISFNEFLQMLMFKKLTEPDFFKLLESESLGIISLYCEYYHYPCLNVHSEEYYDLRNLGFSETVYSDLANDNSTPLNTEIAGIGATLKHRDCVRLLIEYYIPILHKKGILDDRECNLLRMRGVCHDMDKVCCSLAYPQLTADYFHRLFNGHHVECYKGKRSKLDFIEQIIDWESGPYTKSYANSSLGTLDAVPVLNAYHSLYILNKKMLTECDDCGKTMTYYLEAMNILPLRGTVDGEPVFYFWPVIKVPNIKYTRNLLFKAIGEYINATHILELPYLSRVDESVTCVNYTDGLKALIQQDRTSNSAVKDAVMPRGGNHNTKFYNSLEQVDGHINTLAFNYDGLVGLSLDDISKVENHSKDILSHFKTRA